MAQANIINIEIDSELQQELAKYCDNLGMSMSAMLCELARIELCDKKMASNASGYDENGFITEAELLRRMEDARAGRNLVKHGLDEM